MKYLKDPTTLEVFAYELDGSQDAYIRGGLVPMSPEEVYTHLNPPPPRSIPSVISAAQGQLALVQAGHYDAAVSIIESITDPTEKLKAEINFYRRNDWERSNTVLSFLAGELNLSESDLDDLFILGSTL